MEAKRSVSIFISLVSGMIILFLTTLYVYDPLQVFHKTWGRDTTFHKNMRQQAAGIINNYEFDSVILGTSMLENTSANEVSQKLGGNFINISISGGNFYERSLILEYTLYKKNIKKILYTLDNSLRNNILKGHNTYSLNSFNYLYDQNNLNDLKVYMNDKYLKCLLTFSRKGECVGIKKDFDRLNAWYKVKYHSMRFGGLENWFKAKNSQQVKKEFKKISTVARNVKNGKSVKNDNIEKDIVDSKKYIDKTIIKYVKSYPNTKFILVIPPYSRMLYAQWAQYNKSTFKIYKNMIQYIVTKSDQFDNLKIFGWGNHSFVDDISMYKDPQHFEYTINSWMLDAISREEGLLLKSNIDQYLDLFTQKALEFDLIKLGEKFDNYLQSNK